jgi:hypothetical protein
MRLENNIQQLLKILTYIIILMVFSACNCPKCNPVIKYVYVTKYDTIINVDTVYTKDTHFIDSMAQVRHSEINAYYLQLRQYLIDTTELLNIGIKNNFLASNAKIDSIFKSRKQKLNDTILLVNTEINRLWISNRVKIDSINAVKKAELVLLHQEAMNEATEYRNKSIQQVYSMRDAFLAWRDSIRNLTIYNNVIVKGDTITKIIFDTNGKPIIIY